MELYELINSTTLADITAQELNDRVRKAKRDLIRERRGDREFLFFFQDQIEILALTQDGERLDDIWNYDIDYSPMYLSGRIAKRDILEHVAKAQRSLEGTSHRVATIAIGVAEYAVERELQFDADRSDYEEPTGDWAIVQISV